MIENMIRDWLRAVATERSIQPIIEKSLIIATDVGIARNENQDRIGALRVQPADHNMTPFMCIAVSDGMGGMRNGAECATLTVAAFFRHLVENRERDAKSRLESAAHYANKAVNEYARGKGGATLSAVLVDQNGAVQYVNVGDSRIYVARDTSPRVERITIDDTLKDAFGGTGNELVQFIGVGPSMVPRIGSLPRNTRSIFLTSDGAHFIDHDLLEKVIGNASDPVRAAERVIALARWLGGPDNASISGFYLEQVVEYLRQPSASPVTLWSGMAQLQLAYLPEAPVMRRPPQDEPTRDDAKQSDDLSERTKYKKSQKRIKSNGSLRN
jgi:PPM family protein phosphatase